MKIFASTILVAFAAAGSASASTIYFVGSCGSFSNPAPNSSMSGSWICPTAASLGDTAVAAEFVVYNSDYSSGLATSVTAVTNWSFSGAAFQFATDTTTSTGGANSSGAVSMQTGLPVNPFVNLPPLILAGAYDDVTSLAFGTPTISWTNYTTVGSAVQTTGYAEVVYGENIIPGQPPTTPEPGSIFLMGAGLWAVHQVSRRKIRDRVL